MQHSVKNWRKKNVGVKNKVQHSFRKVDGMTYRIGNYESQWVCCGLGLNDGEVNVDNDVKSN